MNTVIKIAPNGTYLAVTSPFNTLLHSIDPMAIPMEKIDRNSVTTLSSPFNVTLAKVGN